MKYDQTFARFARRMIRQTAIAAGIFAMAGTMYWNWQVGAGQPWISHHCLRSVVYG